MVIEHQSTLFELQTSSDSTSPENTKPDGRLTLPRHPDISALLVLVLRQVAQS